MRFLLSLLIVLSNGNFSNAQALSDVYISYSIEVDSDEPAASMLTFGSSLELAFRGLRTKALVNVAGGTNSISVVVDHKTKTGTALMDILDGKKAVKIKTEKYDNALSEIKKISDNPIRHTDDFKTIAGYSCQKVFMKDLKSGANIIFYITDQIVPENDLLAKTLIAEIKGFPLGLVVRRDGTTVRIIAEKVSSSTPPASVFSLSVPDGYTLSSFDELEDNIKIKSTENR